MSPLSQTLYAICVCACAAMWKQLHPSELAFYGYIYIYMLKTIWRTVTCLTCGAQLISCNPNLGQTGHRVDGDIERRNIPTNDSTALACLGCLRCCFDYICEWLRLEWLRLYSYPNDFKHPRFHGSRFHGSTSMDTPHLHNPQTNVCFEFVNNQIWRVCHLFRYIGIYIYIYLYLRTETWNAWQFSYVKTCHTNMCLL